MKINWYKWIVFAVIIIAIFLAIRSCGKGGDFFGCNRHGDTISVRYDSTIVVTKDSIVYVPQPYEVIKFQDRIAWRDRIDSFIEDRILPTDTAAILADYYAIRTYKDTVIQQNGIIFIDDTVSENKIILRGVRSELQKVLVYQTITVEASPKNIWYWGFSAMGARKDPFFAAGTDLSVKWKSDKITGLGAKIDNKGVIYGEAQLKIPIRLGKRR